MLHSAMQCFMNRLGGLIECDDEAVTGKPPAMWFIAPTHSGQEFKVSFSRRGQDIDIKSVSKPTEEDRRTYLAKAY